MNQPHKFKTGSIVAYCGSFWHIDGPHGHRNLGTTGWEPEYALRACDDHARFTVAGESQLVLRQTARPSPDHIADHIAPPAGNDIVHSPWSNRIYPCSENCGFTGPLDAFTHGECYLPCPRCGARREQRTGRFIYRLTPKRWAPFLKTKTFVAVEWREP